MIQLSIEKKDIDIMNKLLEKQKDFYIKKALALYNNNDDDEFIRQKMNELNMKYNRINSISKIIKMEG